MTTLDDMIDDVADQATGLLNSEGRSASHVAFGIILTVGFAVAATTLATRAQPARPQSLRPTIKSLRRNERPVVEKPRGAFSLILPAVFSATTLSAVRVWNAPASPERSTAMGLWFLAQTINAIALGLRPTSMRNQVAAAASSAALAAAFAYEARKLDHDAGKMASPSGIGVKVANFFGRKTERISHTLH